ncbi:Uncharacterised protein [Mycobacteroides abscessus subsp. bolletii]|nr:Uncharacterised protein [Mycobacteroides abscessus subsp. bolletii]SLD36865.1 Uncharacterised protein [Mycobacteroides abscessus subsp. bolletii]
MSEMAHRVINWFRRLLGRPWTPFDHNGNLRPELFTHEGWHRIGALRESYDEQTGGLHPEEVCGEDCSGCCSKDEWK